LTVGLRALAILDENKKASANIEANLVAAFRKNAVAAQTPVPAVSARSHKSRINYWWAAAAVLLILFAIAALRIQQKYKVEQAPDQLVQQQPKPQELVPNNREDKQIAPDVVGVHREDITPVTHPRRVPRKMPAVKIPEKDSNESPTQVAGNSSTGKSPAEETIPSQQPPAESEVTTPFISLTQGYTLPMPEGGQVLRVEMPRSALASFGLSVNEERLNERVKADVVVGNDGIPRAIRFVR
jgi:hypothetical protein